MSAEVLVRDQIRGIWIRFWLRRAVKAVLWAVLGNVPAPRRAKLIGGEG